MSTLRENPIVDRRSSVDDLVDAVTAALALLRDLPPGEGGEILPTPSDIEADQWIREVWTDRGGSLRPRKTLARDASDEARALAGIMRWHQSGGDLTGLMIARMTAGDAFDRVDTLSTVTRIVAGAGRSRAVAAWERTGLIR